MVLLPRNIHELISYCDLSNYDIGASIQFICKCMTTIRAVTSLNFLTGKKVVWSFLILIIAASPAFSEPPLVVNISCTGCDAGNPSEEISFQDPTRVEVFRVKGPGTVQISNVMGDITFRDTDSDEVRVEMYVKRSFTFWGESRRDDLRMIVVQNKNDVTVNVEPPRGARTGVTGGQEISFIVYAPPYMEVILKTGFGNIRAAGLGSTHDIRTGAGNILIERSRGEGRVLTSAGNIDIQRYTGSIMCLSAGGNINLSNVKGSAKVKTRGGHVRANNMDGSLLAESDGGSINVHMIAVDEGLFLQTKAGDVTANLPSGVGLDVVMRGSRTLMSDWSSFRGVRRNNEVDGAIQGGGTTVNLFTKVGKAEIVLNRSNP